MATRKETHIYKKIKDLNIHLDVYRPDGATAPTPVIIWIHGGALIGGSRHLKSSARIARYLNAGYAVVSIDYRLAPETRLPAIIEDVQEAFQWVCNHATDFNINTNRMATIGHSAGGYLTLMSGTFDTPPKALVSFYGYGDIIGDWYSKPDPFYCTKPAVPKEEAYQNYTGPPVTNPDQRPGGGPFYLYCRQQGIWPNEVGGVDPHQNPDFFKPYCPIQNITKQYPPTLLLHGTNDTDVTYDQSVIMAEALTKAGIENELITIQDGGHGFEGGPGETDPQVIAAWKKVMAFLEKHI